MHTKIVQDYEFFFGRIKVRRLYPADELVALLAVGGVTRLGQGGERARLHVPLTGRLVFALRMEMYKNMYS